MASAYAALVSLMNTISMEQTPRFDPRHQISIDKRLIEALQESVDFMAEFLEQGWKVGAHLEARIVNAAYAAEDAIESYIVDNFPAGYESSDKKPHVLLSQDLFKEIMGDMEQIKESIMHVKKDGGNKGIRGGSSRSASSSSAPQGEKIAIEGLHQGSSTHAGSSSSSPRSKQSKMVGVDDEKIQVMDKLTRLDTTSRGVISIVGMAGIGKTTLARNIYHDKLIVEHFDVHAWITVSQNYNVKKILIGIIFALEKQGSDENLCKSREEMCDEHLGEDVHKGLSGRRYLIVLDDIWSIDVWEKIKRFFPNNNNGSRILLTTRLSNIAKQSSTYSLGMKFLDKNNSWNLLCQKVFAQNNCPSELEAIGKIIVKNCKGLPLAIVVVGGLLAKSNKRIEYWEHVAALSSLSEYINDDENCSKRLSLSYDYLPIHLKPCFLYMGVFPEDHEIPVANLINLWIVEGFLKPQRGKKVEEIAREYLKDLIDRNLIIVHKWGSGGQIKSCILHDLLRELCLREAQQEKFLCVVSGNSLSVQLSHYERRIVCRLKYPQILDSLLSTSYARTLIVNDNEELSSVLRSPAFKLLRVLFVFDVHYPERDAEHGCLLKVMFNLVNLRYLAFTTSREFNYVFAPFIGRLRNLQMFFVRNCCDPMKAPSEIWNLPQLRHVEFASIFLPKPPSSTQMQHDCIALQNLRTLKGLRGIRFDKRILKKIHNIKKMEVSYWKYEDMSRYGVQNVGCLRELESFHLSFYRFAPYRDELLPNLAFPHSLKKLTLRGCKLFWEDMTMIGSLPHLEVLKLRYYSFIGSEWNPVQGEFLRLKFLYMDWLKDLMTSNVDSTHFPRLEQLVLRELGMLKEIPRDIGEIATLRLIRLVCCADSVIISAKNILEEQQNLGNDGLVIEIL